MAVLFHGFLTIITKNNVNCNLDFFLPQFQKKCKISMIKNEVINERDEGTKVPQNLIWHAGRVSCKLTEIFRKKSQICVQI